MKSQGSGLFSCSISWSRHQASKKFNYISILNPSQQALFESEGNHCNCISRCNYTCNKQLCCVVARRRTLYMKIKVCIITHSLSILCVCTQCWISVSENRPWHCQVHIHRDAFSYGEVGPNIDTRPIVDLRWFGRVKPCYENCVDFSHTNRDTFGMPQPTFHFRMTKEEGDEVHKMMTDMCKAATYDHKLSHSKKSSTLKN